MPINFVFFLAWITTSFLLASYLKRKVFLFKKKGALINSFGGFVVFLTLHNVISNLLNIQEVTFLFLSIMFFGITLSLMILKRKDYQKEKTEKEMTDIQKISAQSQVNNYNRDRSKK